MIRIGSIVVAADPNDGKPPSTSNRDDIHITKSHTPSDWIRIEHGDIDDLVRALWQVLSSDQRTAIIHTTCRSCGDLDPRCYCQRDPEHD